MKKSLVKPISIPIVNVMNDAILDQECSGHITAGALLLLQSLSEPLGYDIGGLKVRELFRVTIP